MKFGKPFVYPKWHRTASGRQQMVVTKSIRKLVTEKRELRCIEYHCQLHNKLAAELNSVDPQP